MVKRITFVQKLWICFESLLGLKILSDRGQPDGQQREFSGYIAVEKIFITLK